MQPFSGQMPLTKVNGPWLWIMHFTIITTGQGMMSSLDLSLKSAITLIQLPRYVCLGMPVLHFGATTSRWAQTSRMEAMITSGNFCWFLPCHSSLIPLVFEYKNRQDLMWYSMIGFTSVTLVGGDKAFDPSQWQELFTTLRYQHMFDSTDPNVLLK